MPRGVPVKESRTAQEWEDKKKRILELYIQQRNTLAAVCEILGEEGFHVTQPSVKKRLGKWMFFKSYSKRRYATVTRVLKHHDTKPRRHGDLLAAQEESQTSAKSDSPLSPQGSSTEDPMNNNIAVGNETERSTPCPSRYRLPRSDEVHTPDHGKTTDNLGPTTVASFYDPLEQPMVIDVLMHEWPPILSGHPLFPRDNVGHFWMYRQNLGILHRSDSPPLSPNALESVRELQD